MANLVSQSQKWESYYGGDKRVDALGVSLPPQMRVLEMPVRWPKLSIDVLVESLVLEGFKLADGPPPEDLNRILQANNFDTLLTLGLTEALIQGAAFVVAGGREDSDIPMLSVHKGDEFSIKEDYQGRIIQAVRRYRKGSSTFKAVYEPGRTAWYQVEGSLEVLIEEAETGYDRVPVVPLVNRKRIGEEGQSEIEDISTLCDAASRSLTNLQVAQELLAMPVRYLFGDDVKSQFKNADGSQKSRVEAYLGHYIVGPKGSTAGSIPGSDLNQIINSFKVYAQQVSALTGIPPFMMGISADSNPASAEAMRSAKDRLITRAEMKQHIFGDAVEDIARMVLALAGVEVDGLETLEARWRDPAVASVSSRNALMLQAHAQGIITEETAREYLGLSPEQMARERHTDNREASTVGG